MSQDLPEEAYLAALAALPGVGPARLGRLLSDTEPRRAWQRIEGSGDVSRAIAGSAELLSTWRAIVSKTDVQALWSTYQSSGTGVVGSRSPAFPDRLRDDPEPPAVLFTRGEPSICNGATVAIVGTRKCTRYGVDLAFELGGLLARSGVSVVSGLAKGIDAAAHRGALEARGAPPIAVVGGGVDVQYPSENRDLWERIGSEGLICAEAPLGSAPERWRFPARNRIVAGLSEVTVVVESHLSGGSLYTASQALDRGRLVLAVPGSIRSSASSGCNRLLADGCHPLCAVDDVLVALDLLGRSEPSAPEAVSDQEMAVLDAVGWHPVAFDEVLSAVGLELEVVASVLDSLVQRSLLVPRGPWFERAPVQVRLSGSNDPPSCHDECVRPRPAS